MFLGHFRHQLDSKGRVAVPAGFRKDLGAGSVITFGPESRLVMWPAEQWELTASRLSRADLAPADERAYMRMYFANAREVELDGQGRLLLTPEQRSFARIGDRAVFVGMGSCVEVVGEDVFNAETAPLTPEDFTSLHDTLNARGNAPAPTE